MVKLISVLFPSEPPCLVGSRVDVVINKFASAVSLASALFAVPAAAVTAVAAFDMACAVLAPLDGRLFDGFFREYVDCAAALWPPLGPSSRPEDRYLGEKISELSAAGAFRGTLRAGQRPASGLSWLARWIARVRALVVLYRRRGALPARRCRKVRQVEVLQVLVPQPSRS